MINDQKMISIVFPIFDNFYSKEPIYNQEGSFMNNKGNENDKYENE